jgi:hypothetical protein
MSQKNQSTLIGYVSERSYDNFIAAFEGATGTIGDAFRNAIMRAAPMGMPHRGQIIAPC